MTIFKKFKNLSLKIHLVVGLSLIHGLLISVFSYDFISKQKENINNHFWEEARSTALTFSVGSISAVLARDYAGLREMNQGLGFDVDMLYAFIYLPDGKIISHTSGQHIGQYVADPQGQTSLRFQKKLHIVANNSQLIDVASPVISQGKIIAWVRVGITKDAGNLMVQKVILNGALYTLFAMFIGFIFSLWIANLITGQLNQLILMAKKVELGDHTVRARVESENEVGKLALVFNSMLDTLHQEEAKLVLSEERFELAMKASNDGLWDVDLESGKVYHSNRWLEILGINASEFNPGVDEWKNRIHPDDLDDALIAFNKLVSGETPFYLSEHRLRHNDGHYVPTLSRGIGVVGPKGNVVRVVGTQTDISLQKSSELEKESMYEQLRQSQKMEAIGQLTGGIAHDFNNILAGIIGFTELGLRRENLDDKTKGYFFHVSKLAIRARDLIRQMLIYSRGGDPDPKVINMNKVIGESLKLLKPMLTDEIQLVTHFKSKQSIIKMDPVQLQQIVMNLAINARDAMSKGNGKFELTLKTIDSVSENCASCGCKIEGKWIELMVADNGDGISEDVLKKMFEPFFSTKAPSKGTGMGLSMVHGIVHRNQGHILVSSIPGVGTTFKLYFPEVQEVASSESVEVIRNENPVVTDRKRILVVDDEDFIRGFVSEFLSDVGYECLEAINGHVALEMMKNDPLGFDLVITDFTMPEMSGLELIEQIRKYWPHQLVILSSGNIDIALDQSKKHLRIDALLLKPYEIDDALVVIKNLLQSSLTYKVA